MNSAIIFGFIMVVLFNIIVIAGGIFALVYFLYIKPKKDQEKINNKNNR